MSNIYKQMPDIGLHAAIAVAHIKAIEMDKARDARIKAISMPGNYADLENPFPIIHQHGTNASAAERHCFTLVTGGWSAKMKHIPAEGWQVVVTGFRGVQHAHSVC